MRTWGRIPLGSTSYYSPEVGEFVVSTATGDDQQWVEVATDNNGFNDAVWLTTLAQVLKLGLNESPMFGNYGIPAQQSVVTQVLPYYYVLVTQQYFANYFLELLVNKLSETDPSYAINVTANPGAIIYNPVPT